MKSERVSEEDSVAGMEKSNVNALYHGKILVVDDDKAFRTFLMDVLSAPGHNVTCVNDGDKAIALLGKESYDLMLTDLLMPNINGLDLLAHSVNLYPDTPVILITGMGDLDITIQAIRRGAYDFLLKPIESVDFLYQSVNRALERRHLLKERQVAKERLTVSFEEQTRELRRTKLLKEIGEFLQMTFDEPALFHMILTAATSGFAANFNRAAIFLSDPDADYLKGRMAMGPLTAEEAGRIWDSITREELSLSDLMHRTPVEHTEINNRIVKMGIALSETADPVVACLQEKATVRIDSKSWKTKLTTRLREEIGYEYFVAAPLLAAGRTLGVIIADNRFSGQAIDNDRVHLLSLLANQAAMALDNVVAYNRLSEHVEHLKKAQTALIEAERMAAIGRMAAQIAHEIRNPLTSIGGFAQRILMKHEPDEPTRKACSIIVQQVERLENSLRNLTNFARLTPPEFAKGNVNSIIQTTRDVLEDAASGNFIQIRLVLDPLLPETFFDPSEMQQVLLNVGKNGIEAMTSGGTLTFTTRSQDGLIVIETTDTGVGMDPRVLRLAMDPFFTTKSIGMGLGLAVVKEIVAKHGGKVEIESRLAAGTTIRIYLPIRNA